MEDLKMFSNSGKIIGKSKTLKRSGLFFKKTLALISVAALVFFTFPIVSWGAEVGETFTDGELTYTINNTNNETVSVKAANENISGNAGTLTIPDKVTYNNAIYTVNMIDNMAFLDCSNLTSVEIPDSVKSIGVRAFENCTALESIIIPDSVTFIDSSAFNGCTALTTIKLPNLLKTINMSVFENCTALTSVEISNSVTYISGSAFVNCTALTSVEISNSVTYISTTNA